MACTSAFIDILSTPTPPSELGFCTIFDSIRHEAASVFQTEEDWGKLSSLHKLSRIDSALRESMRLNPLFGRGTMQQVMHKQGVVLPPLANLPGGPGGSPDHGVVVVDGGSNNHHTIRILEGAWLGVSLTGTHDGRKVLSESATI